MQLVADLAQLFFRLGLLLQRRSLISSSASRRRLVASRSARSRIVRASVSASFLRSRSSSFTTVKVNAAVITELTMTAIVHLVKRRYDRTYHIPLPYRDQRGNRSAVVKRSSPCGVPRTGTPHQQPSLHAQDRYAARLGATARR